MRAQHRASGRPHPGLLRAMQATGTNQPSTPGPAVQHSKEQGERFSGSATPSEQETSKHGNRGEKDGSRGHRQRSAKQDLLHRARAEDTLHWKRHKRPISAETLRKCLRVGAPTARDLVAQLRSDTSASLGPTPITDTALPPIGPADGS